MDLLFELRHFVKSKIRTGRQFRALLAQFTASQRLSADQLREWQLRHLQRTVASAYEHVPYYRDALRAAGVTPGDIRTLDDLARLPITEKAAIRSHGEQFLHQRHRGLKFTAHTSGSTGTPLKLRRDVDAINAENAFLWRFWMSHGKQFGSARATVRADLISDVRSERLWVYNRFQHDLLLSAFHLNEQHMGPMLAKLQDYRPFDLYAYPSTAYVLAEYAARHGLALELGAVFTSSEQLFPHQQELIERQFHTKVRDWYGQAERVSAIAHCSHGRYHVQEDYALTELLPVGGDEYEIIGTSFFNHLMPLIRYRTGDRVVLEAGSCGCGSPFRLVKSIAGRTASYLLAPDGRKVSLVNHIPRGVPHLIEAQFVQVSPTELCINVVCEEQFSAADAAMLIARASERISPDMHYRIERLAAIPRSASGKFIPIIPLPAAAGSRQP
jgi:phenylacetate-CoA ligase